MLLAIDVGNTNIVLGIFRGDQLLGHWRLATYAERMPDEYAVLVRSLLDHDGKRMSDVDGVAISSVVPPLTATFRELAERYFDISPIVVSADIETGIKISTDVPREVGADRIANALAAVKIHSAPAIVVDFGTATTFDAISADAELLGTAIAPGFLTAMEGLYRHAAQLHLVELRAPRAAIGRNTAEALRSGAIYGYVGLVEGLVHRIRLELGGNPLVIATGGLAPAVVNETTVFEAHDPDLTLHGLRLIHALNVSDDATGRSDDGARAGELPHRPVTRSPRRKS